MTIVAGVTFPVTRAERSASVEVIAPSRFHAWTLRILGGLRVAVW